MTEATLNSAVVSLLIANNCYWYQVRAVGDGDDYGGRISKDKMTMDNELMARKSLASSHNRAAATATAQLPARSPQSSRGEAAETQPPAELEARGPWSQPGCVPGTVTNALLLHDSYPRVSILPGAR